MDMNEANPQELREFHIILRDTTEGGTLTVEGLTDDDGEDPATHPSPSFHTLLRVLEMLQLSGILLPEEDSET